MVGKILSKSGILKTNAPFIITSREELIGNHIGDTEKRVIEIINKSVNGILFIDEAYSLSGSSKRDFGKQAISVLVNQLDIHKNDICVIFAGYKNEMIDFLNFNPRTS